MKYRYAIYENRIYRFLDQSARDAFVWDCQAKPTTSARIKHALANVRSWTVDDIAGGEFAMNPTKGRL